MKPLIILITVFCITSIVARIAKGDWEPVFGGNLAMCLMLIFTALGHFLFTKGMTMMIPEPIPLKKELVYLTGMAEIVLGLALLFPSMRQLAGIILMFMFVAMLPANIHAALKNINYETATYDGNGVNYLWFRVSMQLFLLLWVFYFAVRSHIEVSDSL